jgi:hypothetical protein
VDGAPSGIKCVKMVVVTTPSEESRPWARLAEVWRLSRELASMRRLAKVYSGKTGQLVCEMTGSGQCDPEIIRLFSEGYLEPRRNAAKAVLRRGVAQGEFRADIDLDATLDALYGPIFHRMMIRHAPNDDSFLGFLADAVFDAIAQNR